MFDVSTAYIDGPNITTNSPFQTPLFGISISSAWFATQKFLKFLCQLAGQNNFAVGKKPR